MLTLPTKYAASSSSFLVTTTAPLKAESSTLRPSSLGTMSRPPCFLRYSSRVKVLSSSSGSRGLRASAFSPAGAPSVAEATPSTGAASHPEASLGASHSVVSAAASVAPPASALSSELPSSPPQPW